MNFYRRRRNHQKRQKDNLDGRIKPNFIRVFVEDEKITIKPEMLEYAKKYGIDIIVIVDSKYRKEATVDNGDEER